MEGLNVVLNLLTKPSVKGIEGLVSKTSFGACYQYKENSLDGFRPLPNGFQTSSLCILPVSFANPWGAF